MVAFRQPANRIAICPLEILFTLTTDTYLHVGTVQAPLKKVDEVWDGMLKALNVAASASTDADRTFDEGGLVTPESWMARASALALCVRDSGVISDAAMSR